MQIVEEGNTLKSAKMCQEDRFPQALAKPHQGTLWMVAKTTKQTVYVFSPDLTSPRYSATSFGLMPPTGTNSMQNTSKP